MAKKSSGRQAEDYLQWAGWFELPHINPVVHERRPEWRKREIEFMAWCKANNRTYSFEDLNELRREVEAEIPELPENDTGM